MRRAAVEIADRSRVRIKRCHSAYAYVNALVADDIAQVTKRIRLDPEISLRVRRRQGKLVCDFLHLFCSPENTVFEKLIIAFKQKRIRPAFVRMILPPNERVRPIAVFAE